MILYLYPDKSGQIHLFRELNITHPHTEIYSNVDALRRHSHDLEKVSGS
ncbi:MAG: hypothetical protein QF466_00835 [Desulfobacterales bacterium]|jgi:hypothetical protein|nr:hypothetical protein [Desulfobacterales bacterium]MDP6681686.1 hypothetical protein [Desulfobacterales bacterium]MDP6807421.1 hypothetical protein [Desulfobacterales bacterium]MDP7076664.1 hypothetical protein [Desulfobacterales bacterium]MDP7353841.1 hypothetical protein [Desulfobacterales bacterium]